MGRCGFLLSFLLSYIGEGACFTLGRNQIISRITEVLKDSTLIHRRLTQLRHPFETPRHPYFRDRSFPHRRPKLGVLRNSMSPFSVNVSDRGLSVTRPGFPDRAGPASKGWQRDTGSSPWTPGCRGIGGREWTMTLSRPPWRGDHAPSPSSYWVPRGISPTARPRNYRSFSCSVDWASVLYARGATKSTGGKEEGTRAAVSLPPLPQPPFPSSRCRAARAIHQMSGATSA